ncbi:hypothetical protein MCAP1_002818 [Malassezia caprae]|uniref:Uncharacterized protein n=1 Tax=Malassezia caprae TaxID=1381934 RepID=A0AAF0IWF0_9BASI|nr:hypothetical protein MCAP1_002818 [Malassezia caprae]
MARFLILSALASLVAVATAAPASITCQASGSPVVALAYKTSEPTHGYQIIPSHKGEAGKHMTKQGHRIMSFSLRTTKNAAVDQYWNDDKENQFIPYHCTAASSNAVLAGGWTEFRHATNKDVCLSLNGAPKLVPHAEIMTDNNLMTLKPCATKVDSNRILNQVFTAPTGKTAQKNADNTLTRGGVALGNHAAYLTTDSSGSKDVYDFYMKQI